jgi:hypothetical protein
LDHYQVDVAEVFIATKAVRQIVAGVDRCSLFAASRALEAEVTIALLGNRTVTAKPNDRQLHRQVVANRAE